MRAVFLLALIGATGCASSRTGTSTETQAAAAAPGTQVLLVDANGRVYRRTGDAERPVELTVPGSVAGAVQAVIGAYGELGIPTATAEPATGLVRSPEFEAPSRMAGRPISSYVDCGSDPLGAPRAASYAVHLIASSTVTAADSGRVTIGTAVRATARQRGVSADPIACESTGSLEKRLNLQAAARLAK